jgi:hypothetical protein
MEAIEAQGFWNNRIANKSSNFREIMAIFMALLAFRNLIQGLCVQIMSDNVTALAYISHLGGPSMELTQIATAIWRVALMNRITLKTHHVPGVLNHSADFLSRLNPIYEWQLSTSIFQHIDFMWGPHTVDRFATHVNTQLPVYNSRYADPFSSGIDALAQTDWGNQNNFVNPPFRLLQKVINMIVSQKAVATIIAPVWRAQTWYKSLQALSVAPPFRIPQQAVRRYPGAEPLRNNKWVVCAWRVSAKLI